MKNRNEDNVVFTIMQIFFKIISLFFIHKNRKQIFDY